MNWGEIQIESLKKMYLNNDNITVSQLDNLKADKRYKTYLFAMPQACNEGIRKILSVKPNVKSYLLKYKEDTNKYDLKKVVPKFKQLYDIVYNGNVVPSYHIEGDNILVIDNWKNIDENFTIYYESFHDLIKTDTNANTAIDLDRELVTLLPLYIAGELYKDDDIQQSTIWINEFENALTEVKQSMNTIISNPNMITTVYGVDW